MALPEITTNPERYGTVRWTGLVTRVDTAADPDDLPDKSAIEGVIIFKPSSPLIAYPTAAPKYTSLLFNRQVPLQDAQITELDRKFIKLEACVEGMVPAVLNWTASFSIGFNGVIVRIPDVMFSLQPSQEIDLTDLISMPSA
ncbi:hypothetical protein TIN4_4 [Tsukamurella phage TIN4]|uniref:Uncharacterized protein n=2 Tax=Tinduovirus TIN3 TaxID=1982571 RepID=A0A0K0N5C7_9CAUD|nr:hypothetical protein AVT54_gp004 [Tsukamurella phage TIN3]YP_009604134.1 hypothetical protein FDH87_gp004 [Tsukamurella phage TIN4]AKJ71801.1 hypothetical protein TIN3_4 [Tsukamurella phage TIN3]AKJ71910.1 hypothetical protein TIN4_4 [Tsukamurella phage TIN4]